MGGTSQEWRTVFAPSPLEVHTLNHAPGRMHVQSEVLVCREESGLVSAAAWYGVHSCVMSSCTSLSQWWDPASGPSACCKPERTLRLSLIHRCHRFRRPSAVECLHCLTLTEPVICLTE